MSRALWVLLCSACAQITAPPADPAFDQTIRADEDLRRHPDLVPPADLLLPDLAPSIPLDQGPYSYPRINEVVVSAFGANADEYVEIIGAEGQTALKNYELRYQTADGSVATLLRLDDHMLEPRGYLLITASASQFAPMADQLFPAAGTGKLAKSGGAVALFDAAGMKLDSLAWGNAMVGNSYVEDRPAPAPGNLSVSRMPDGFDSNHNHFDARVASLTPRAQNRP